MTQFPIANAFWNFLHKIGYFINAYAIYFLKRAMKSIILQYSSLYSYILAKT